MKVNLQKIIIFVSAFIVGIFSLSIVSFASESEVEIIYKVGKDVYVDTTNLINSYTNGEISCDDLFTGLTTIASNASLSYLDHEANQILSLLNSLKRSVGGSEHGGGSSSGSRQPITDIWNDICKKNNVPTETTQTPSTDMMGAGAKAVITYPNGSSSTFTCAYITVGILDDNGKREVVIYSGDGQSYKYELQKDGTYKLTWQSGSSSKTSIGNPFDTGHGLVTSDGTTFKLYGDVRTLDGEKFPTDDEVITGTIIKFDEMTDKELEELIEDFQTTIENENPDLDEIEDILKAIYWKLKQQDDDTVTPDDLDSLINSAINRLLAKDCACGDILALLQEMKLCENVQDIRDKLFEIYPDYDYETEVSKIEELKTIFLAKWSFVEELKTLIERFMSSYEKNSSLNAENVIHVQYHPSNGSLGNAILNVSGSYDIKFDIFKPYLPTVRSIIAAFIYLSYAWNTYRKIPSYIRGGDTT